MTTTNKRKRPYVNLPLAECVRLAEQQIAKGYTVNQTFTCAGCGTRLAMPEPNAFYESGSCDCCGATTDIRKSGCGFNMRMQI